jgi:hypothetical protein
MRALVLGLLLIAGCASKEEAKPEVPTLDPDNTCTLYSSGIHGWSIKEAVFKPEIIGTPGLKQGVVFDNYTPFSHCMNYSVTVANSWCECHRESSKKFEDDVEKQFPKGKIVWIKGKS